MAKKIIKTKSGDFYSRTKTETAISLSVYTSFMSSEEKAPNEKDNIWQEKLNNLEYIVDRLGRHIDPEIKETLVAFDLNNFPTDGSCGGHLEESRIRFPYITGEAEGKPIYSRIGEEKVSTELAAKYNIPLQEIRHNKEAHLEFMNLLRECDLTDDAKAWIVKTKQRTCDLELLLAEFNLTRSAQAEVQLSVRKMPYSYRVEPKAYAIPPKELSQDEIERVRAEITASREEFTALTQFLKERYFAQ